MIRLLPVPGLQTLAEYDVAVFPCTRPVDGHIVAVWNDDGEYMGSYQGVYMPHLGITLKSITNASYEHVITSNDNRVYWKYIDVGRGTGPAFEKVSPDQINPGDKIEMFEQWWNVRYINFYAGSRWFQLQREEDELHPLCDKTCMKVEFHDGLHVRIKRMLPARGGRDA